MRIWVDADAFPAVLKEVLYRVSERRQIAVTMVANQSMRLPPSPLLSCTVVPGGFNAADDHIVDQVEAGDLVITADIPLADRAITRGATALNPRGHLYTETNIKDRLGMRNLLDELRSGGEITGGPAPFSAKDRQEFINQLDRFITRRRLA